MAALTDRESLFLLLCAYLYYQEDTNVIGDTEYDKRLNHLQLSSEIKWSRDMVGFDVKSVKEELNRIQEKHILRGITMNMKINDIFRPSEKTMTLTPTETTTEKRIFDFRLEQESEKYKIKAYCPECFFSTLEDHIGYNYCLYSHGELLPIERYNDYEPSDINN